MDDKSKRILKISNIVFNNFFMEYIEDRTELINESYIFLYEQLKTNEALSDSNLCELSKNAMNKWLKYYYIN